MSEYRKYSPREARAFIAAGTLSFATTFLASRGDNHSFIHKNVLAPIALGAELTVAASGWGLMAFRENKTAGKYLRSAGRIGLGTTAACHLAVALTDMRIVDHFQSGKGFSGPDLLDLGQKLSAEFKRNIKEGAHHIFNS